MSAANKNDPWPANLLVPGAGLILTGKAIAGLALGLAFTAAINALLITTLLFPDDYSTGARQAVAALTGVAYAAAQLLFAHELRSSGARLRRGQRDACLRAARASLARRAYDEALRAIQPVAALAKRDLLVAYRLAQILSALERADAAALAWELVRRLDRHRIYQPAQGSAPEPAAAGEREPRYHEGAGA